MQRSGAPMRHILRTMVAILGVLLVVWLVNVVIGFVVKGLVWLAIICTVLFVATAVDGWIKRKGTRTAA